MKKRTKPDVGHLVAYPEVSLRSITPPLRGYEAGVGLVVDAPGIWLVILGPDGDVYSGIRRDSVEVISV
jgi:hypothetical protein